MSVRIALAGNPNSGKTTLFNRLTGTRQTTGNWPGVTVEKKTGHVRHTDREMVIIDLPGIYSLSPYSLEETISRNYIVDECPDVVVNIIDATNLERNLYLTLQLKKLGRPLIVALNMMDEILSHGDKLDIDRLAQLLQIPVVPISAKKGEGLDELVDAISEVSSLGCRRRRPGRRHRHQGRSGCCAPAGRRADDATGGATHAVAQEKSVLHTFRPETEAETEAMYRHAAQIHDQVLQHSHQRGALSRSDKIDRFLTHRILAIPIFLLVMLTVFQVTFSEALGGRLTHLLDIFFSETVASGITRWLDAAAAPEWIGSLLIDGILSGVGGILTFLPQITLLFFFLSVLEDTGYMARAAFITDRIFQKLGLSGRSFIPMLMGFGCTVPAVMAARTLESERDRRLTILITPFMSCSARMPIYAFLAGVFFSTHKGLVTFSMYLTGIVIAVLTAFVFSRTVLRGADAPFIIELPPYRLPDTKSLLLHVWDKVRDFIIKAGTIIFVMTVVVWFFQSFDITFRRVTDGSSSMFGWLGSSLAPLFRPLGFGSWQASVALLTGLIAKESVVATFQILLPEGGLQTLFTPLSAYAFMIFTLLYMPCIAAFSAIRREMNSWRWTLTAVAYQTGVAWLFAFLIYQGGRLLGLG
ncbi:MAG: ferrous iron transport protein B [Clostridiaceae bacterium]|jgi:ferrous iron transport protein B|nr:ferrous iron transport protein B [Clostridiaceae bacterium]